MARVALANAVRNAVVEAVLALVNDLGGPGRILFYSGPVPATPDDSPTVGNTLLAVRELASPSFGTVSAGAAPLNVPLSVYGTDVVGNVVWARVVDVNGNPIMDVDVGVAGAAFTVTSTSIGPSTPLAVTSGSFAMPSGA